MNNKDIVIFELEAIRYGHSMEKCDSKAANKAYDLIYKAYGNLKKQNSLLELESLLEHDSPYVRLWAARYLLPVTTKKAKDILNKLSIIKGATIGLNAKMTLSEWDKGNLQF